MIKKISSAFLSLFYKTKVIHQVGPGRLFLYFFLQRIIGINRKTPWPVHWSSVVTHPQNIQRKDTLPFPGFMPGNYIQAMNGIFIGKNVRLGPGIKIVSASHNVYDYDIHDKTGPIIIGDNCWIAANAVVLPGVELGPHTIVAAGAVVNKSFKEGNCILGGIPAKVIKKLDDKTSNK